MTATRIVPQDAPTLASDAELAAHGADTSAVHGIADTSLLVTTADTIDVHCYGSDDGGTTWLPVLVDATGKVLVV